MCLPSVFYISKEGDYFMKLIFKRILFMFTMCFICLVLLNDKPIYAEETKTLPFEVLVQTPENQMNGIKSYFNLDLKSGQQQILKVDILNKEDTPITINVKSANALTSTHGGIMYVDKRNVTQSKLIDEDFYMDNRLKAPSKVELEGNQSKTIEVGLKAPEKTGVYLGGLLFELDNGTKAQSGLEEVNFTVSNKIEYAVAVQANVDKKEPVVEKETLNVSKPAVEIFPAGPQLHSIMRNSNGEIVRDVQMHYEVFYKGESLFYGDLPAFNIAPKSEVGIAIPWKAEGFEDGDYMLKVKIRENDKTKSFTNEFEISTENVKDYAIKTGAVQPIPVLVSSNYIWIAVIVVGNLVILFIFWRKNKKKKEKEQYGSHIA